MIEEYAKVIKVDESWVWVETSDQSGCGQCHSSGGCSRSMLGKWLKPKENALRLEKTDADLKTGDLVLLGINEGTVLKGSMILYLLPILVTFLAAIAGKWFVSLFASLDGYSELLVSLCGIAGLLISIRIARQYSRALTTSGGAMPVVLKKVSIPQA